MRKTCTVLVAAAMNLITSPYPAHGAERAYVMDGILPSPGLSQIAATLSARGWIVSHGSWITWRLYAADALRHPSDRIAFVGHSMGDEAAFAAGAVVKQAHGNVVVVGLDPLCTHPRMTPGLEATNIWGNYCFGAAADVAGAQNVLISGPTHTSYCLDRHVQLRALEAINERSGK